MLSYGSHEILADDTWNNMYFLKLLYGGGNLLLGAPDMSGEGNISIWGIALATQLTHRRKIIINNWKTFQVGQMPPKKIVPRYAPIRPPFRPNIPPHLKKSHVLADAFLTTYGQFRKIQDKCSSWILWCHQVSAINVSDFSSVSGRDFSL